MNKPITIATRGSQLALWQANHVRDRVRSIDPGREVELLIVKTQGDKILDVPLSKVGGKGLFVKEVEDALLDGRADVAVHSMKDVPSELAPGLTMAAISKREDPRDALCSQNGEGLAELRKGALVGTASLRRMCQLLAARPDLRIESLRGNVPTRLQRLAEGKFDAIVLAAAGLRRLGYEKSISEYQEVNVCLPAAGQGALGIETREEDTANISLVNRAMNDETTAVCVAAERRFLAHLEGGCQAPMAAYAQCFEDELVLDALVGTPDGTQILRSRQKGALCDAHKIGDLAAKEVLAQGADAILKALIEGQP